MSIKSYEKKHLRIMHKLGMNLNNGVRQKHVALLVDSSNKIMNIGFNKSKSDPFQKKNSYSSKVAMNPNLEWSWSHGEVSCLKGYTKEEVKNSTIYVVRVDPDTGKWMESCPCPGCMRLINRLKIPRIVHSNKNGGFTVIEPYYNK